MLLDPRYLANLNHKEDGFCSVMIFQIQFVIRAMFIVLVQVIPQDRKSVV